MPPMVYVRGLPVYNIVGFTMVCWAATCVITSSNSAERVVFSNEKYLIFLLYLSFSYLLACEAVAALAFLILAHSLAELLIVKIGP